ncbi:MAG TPA: LytTR family DNA-binding domain-containing protein [Gemmatimonadaceae bacterium]|nr:LytTR family DNA-binding domain-containing protein [Gemmatimonadaceae bacterium]
MGGSLDRLSVIDGDRVAIRHGASTQVVSREDLICARAARNGTMIVTRRGTFKVREAMSAVVERLAHVGLVQIHRGVAVNSSKIRQLVGRSQHRLAVILDDDVRFAVGRQFQPLIRARFGASRRAG